MRRTLLLLLALSGWGWAEQVQIISPLPLPVSYALSSTTTLTRLPINFNAGGDNIVVPADVSGNRIVVHRIWFLTAGATNITFKDNLGSPAAVPFAANEGVTFDATGQPWFITAANTAFIMNSSVGVQVSGEIYYALAP
jgi:hypothetical protein